MAPLCAMLLHRNRVRHRPPGPIQIPVFSVLYWLGWCPSVPMPRGAGHTECGMTVDHAPPLYLQIATQMAELIRNGTLSRGARMPSVRELARQRGVAQSTVVQAYHWLEDARLIAARPRSGYFVAARPVALPEPTVSRSLRRPRDVSVDWLGQRILGNPHPSDVVSFSSGTPGPDLLDVDRVRRAMTRSVQRHRQLLCTYPSSSGHEDAHDRDAATQRHRTLPGAPGATGRGVAGPGRSARRCPTPHRRRSHPPKRSRPCPCPPEHSR